MQDLYYCTHRSQETCPTKACRFFGFHPGKRARAYRSGEFLPGRVYLGNQVRIEYVSVQHLIQLRRPRLGFFDGKGCEAYSVKSAQYNACCRTPHAQRVPCGPYFSTRIYSIRRNACSWVETDNLPLADGLLCFTFELLHMPGTV